MTLKEIESRLVAACLELRPQYPAAFEGYYDRLLNEGRILTDADRAIVEYVCDVYPMTEVVTEICAGIGQLTHALAFAGMRYPTAVDSDYQRNQVCLAIGKSIGTKVAWCCERWQEYLPAKDLVVCTNAVSGDNLPQDLCYLSNHLDLGGELIWQPSLFGVEGVEPLAGYNSVDLGHGVVHQWK